MKYYLRLFLHMLSAEPPPPRCPGCRRYLFASHVCPERSGK